MRYAVFVLGAAGAGKSRFCEVVSNHLSTIGRNVSCYNLDPAADEFSYTVDWDIRDLITVDDVMSTLQLGPNGALIYALKYLESNLNILQESLLECSDDEYILIDCPGQIELYTHLTVIQSVMKEFTRNNFNVCSIWCSDSLLLHDQHRLISGTLMSLAAMINMECAHLSVLTKVDLLADKTAVDRIASMSIADMTEYGTADGTGGGGSAAGASRLSRLNVALSTLLEQYSLVSYVPLDISDDESVDLLLQHIDHCMGYGEDVEHKSPKEVDEDDDDGGNGADGD